MTDVDVSPNQEDYCIDCGCPKWVCCKKKAALEENDLCKVMFYRLSTEKFLDWLNKRRDKIKLI